MREHRLSYNSPSGNIASGIAVCVVAVSTGHTPKLGLGFSVGFVNTATNRTLPAGVAQIDSDHRHSGPLGLILDKGTKLAEAPVMQAFPLRFIGLNPRTDTLKILKGNTETGAFRREDLI